MIYFVPDASLMISMDTIKAVLPIGIGLASAAYLTMQAAKSRLRTDKSVPMVNLRPGDSTHDSEYNEDQDAFLQRCEETYGSTFNILLLNKTLTVVSGPQIREVFLNDDLSSIDAFEELTDMVAFFNTMRKSNRDTDHRTIHALVKDHITPNISIFTPKIVEQLERSLGHDIGYFPADDEGKIVENPLVAMQMMVASAMANVFMGPEIAKSRTVIETFIQASVDFAAMHGNGEAPRASFWNSLVKRANYKVLNPLQVRVRHLTEVATPVVLERRRMEAEAIEKGIPYDRPVDILQSLLDNFDKYGFVDLEDVCGHLLILVLASVHATTDSATVLLYYMAAFPEFMEILYKEQRQVLDAIQQERQQKREELKKREEPIGEDLDPVHDYVLSSAAIKQMVHLDSFVREMFRYRTERLTLPHRARKTVTLSNGIMIPRGHSVIINMKSAHQGPEQGDSVTEFKPWRFVGKAKAATKVGADFLPFGMGRQEIKTIGALMVSKYSMIEIQDPSKTIKVLRSRSGEPMCTGLVFTAREAVSL
ncbi:hypothetical protein BGX34_012186 [Mortierella sp. NVP85]|nr:hypothetical protein BGX34_012186 [Mortierella sp. NVP85]